MKPISHRLIDTNRNLIPLASHQCYNEMLFEDLLYSRFLGKTHTLQRAKMQSPVTLVKFTIPAIWSILQHPLQSKISYCILCFLPPRNKYNALVGLFQFCRQHILYMGMQERPLQQVQTMIQVALLLGPYDLENSMVLEVSVE